MDFQLERQPQLTAQPSRLVSRLALMFLCLAGLFSLTLPILAANPGDLDPSFGTGGVVAPTFLGDFLSNAIAIQPDGKIVTAGGDPFTDGLFIILRHGPDGSLDNNFGNGGVVTSSFNSFSPFPGLGYGPVGMAIQPDGKIVVVGEKSISPFSKTVVLARYTNAGSLDSTFGQSGVVTSADKFIGFFIGIALQSDGKIVVAGNSWQSHQQNFTLARYTITGTLDSTFGSNGVVTTSLTGRSTFGYGVVIQSNGKIVIAGTSYINNVINSGTFALARYTITGSLDSTFGNGGVITTPIGSHASGATVAIQPDDKIIIVGSSGDLNDSNTATFALARYNSDGSMDNGFGSSGIVTSSINGYGAGNGIALQLDGKIVAVGAGKTITGSITFALVRYNSNGSLDNSFGSNGVVAVPIGNYALGYGVAIQPDHKIVVVGDSTYASGVRFTLARYFGDSTNLTRQVYLPVVLKQ